ncbi:MAG: sulfatase-like hydrolase/transferase, partial [Bacteroidetes bacterium]|nr:sulfatase-like hydrolase/transferase [Bacteroidota bacterium]
MKRYRCLPCLFVALFLGTVSLQAQKTRYVVIVMLDGARYSETFGDSSHSLIPFMWNDLRPQGAIYTKYYNDGKTQTNPGHASVLSGTWQYISNDGSEYSHSPSIFEYLRKQKNIPATECWVALGKAKLNVLANSTHPEYGATYGASVRTSDDPASDQLTMGNVQYVLTNHRSRITIANFANTDIDGHAGSWEKYTASIKKADSLIAVLWNFIQNDLELKNKTTLIVTNDHGRHTTDFVNHGDGCDGCRHIMLMVLGPDTPKGAIDSTLTRQIDIAPTIGKMMRFGTPFAAGKVIESAIASAENVSLSFKNAPTGKIAGDYPLQWSLGAVKETVYTNIELSGDGGRTWQVLLSSPTRDSLFLWKTTEVPDGTRYWLRIQIYGDTSYGLVQTQNEFTIDNPGNGTPDITLLSPDRNIIIVGTSQITWQAADAEGDQLSISLYGSTDNGISWSTIVSGLANTGTYDWNTSEFANSKSFVIKIACSDGTNIKTILSPRFEVDNFRQKIQSVKQMEGVGNGIISIHVCMPEQLTGNVYQIQFNETPPLPKRYSVMNITTNTAVLSNILFPGDGSEGPLFDGLRLAVTDYEEPVHNPDSTRWTVGVSTLFSKVLLPELVLPEGNVQAVPEAADYEIRISNTVIDTSKEYFGALPTLLYFTVYNTSLKKKTPIVLSELSPDGILSFGDDLYLFKKDSSGKDVLTWEIFIDGEEGSTLPQPGDIYKVATYKPITGNDLFEFTAMTTSVKEMAGAPGTFSLSQNFPNPFNPVTTVLASIPN